jgi:hypothetical protein
MLEGSRFPARVVTSIDGVSGVRVNLLDPHREAVRGDSMFRRTVGFGLGQLREDRTPDGMQGECGATRKNVT